MLNIREVLEARIQYQKQHGTFPTKVLVNPTVSAEMASQLKSIDSPSVNLGSMENLDSSIGFDWYEDASVTELERFRLSI